MEGPLLAHEDEALAPLLLWAQEHADQQLTLSDLSARCHVHAADADPAIPGCN